MSIMNGTARCGHSQRALAITAAAAMAALAMTAGGEASAAAIGVCSSGCAYSTLGAALAAAAPGDRIVIGAGTFSGGVTIDKSISVIGMGADSTLISGGNPVMTVGAGASVELSGLSIRGGADTGLRNEGTTTSRYIAVVDNGGAGVVNSGNPSEPTATLVLIDSAVAHNGGTGIDNHGVYFHRPATATLIRVTVNANAKRAFGYGVSNGAQMRIDSSVVTTNTGCGVAGSGETELVATRVDANDGCGVASSYRGSTTIEGGTISGNDRVGVDAGGGPVAATGTTISNNGDGGIRSGSFLSGVELRNVTISGNHASKGGGVSANSAGSVTIIGSRIIDNSADYGGGVATSSSGSVTITDSKLVGNSAAVAGGAIYADFLSRGTLEGSSINASRAPNGAAIFLSGRASWDVQGSRITGNKATGGPGSAGGIFNDGGTVTLHDTLLTGNPPENCIGC